jgi:hypothetical protein
MTRITDISTPTHSIEDTDVEKIEDSPVIRVLSGYFAERDEQRRAQQEIKHSQIEANNTVEKR